MTTFLFILLLLVALVILAASSVLWRIARNAKHVQRPGGMSNSVTDSNAIEQYKQEMDNFYRNLLK
jgi:flagellar basal body-associated protein FliL